MEPPVEFDWHDGKDAANLAKHGLPLVFGARLFLDPDRVTVPTIREEDREERHKMLGAAGGRVYAAVYTMRDEVCWLISVRRANNKEVRGYHGQVPD